MDTEQSTQDSPTFQDTPSRMRKEEAKHTGFMCSSAPDPLRLLTSSSNHQSQTVWRKYEDSLRILLIPRNYIFRSSLWVPIPSIWMISPLASFTKATHTKHSGEY